MQSLLSNNNDCKHTILKQASTFEHFSLHFQNTVIYPKKTKSILLHKNQQLITTFSLSSLTATFLRKQPLL